MNWSEEELAAQLKGNPDLKVADGALARATALRTDNEMMKSNKYHSKSTEYGGWLYDSKKEADLAKDLDLQKRAGIVKFWLAQVPFRLPGKTVYRLDFMVFYPNGTYRLFKIKGKDRKTGRIVTATSASQMKERQIEELYGVSIELV